MTSLAETAQRTRAASDHAEPQANLEAHRQAPSTACSIQAREFLVFKLGSEEYGVDILSVKEIRSFEQPTRIAGARDHILGVLNLRGLIVPIVDLRQKLRLQARFDASTVAIVLNVKNRLVGVVVDSVCDVVSLPTEQLRPVPELGGEIEASHDRHRHRR